jgi:hypothetical protein
MSSKDCVTSINWAGSSLLFTSRSGAVSFLLPYPSNSPVSSSLSTNHLNPFENSLKNDRQDHTLVRSLGFRPTDCRGVNCNDNRSLSMGRLCSLPRHLSSSGINVYGIVHTHIYKQCFFYQKNPVYDYHYQDNSISLLLSITITYTGSLRVVACLPGRLLLAYTSLQPMNSFTNKRRLNNGLDTVRTEENQGDQNMNLNSHLFFSSRPCNPIEPLVLGILSISKKHQEEVEIKKNNERNNVLKSYSVYVPTFDIVNNFNFLRSLVTTFCPAQPAAGMHFPMYLYTYICMYVCMSVFIYTYICTLTRYMYIYMNIY